MIARIEPAGGADLAADDDMQSLDDLERRGTVRCAVTPLLRVWLRRRRKVRADVVKALRAAREEGR